MSNTLTRNFTKKWVLILQEYERIKSKKSERFKTVKQLCEFFEIHRKDIRRYYERWIEADRKSEALMPRKPGPRAGQLKRLSKEEERIIMKIRRRFDSSGPILHEMIKEHFDIPPSVSTIYRTFKRYPLNERRKKAIKRYEKSYPGELAHSDTYRLDPTMVIGRNKYHLAGFIDDCTRLCYVEVLDRATSYETSQAFSRAYKWFMLHGFNLDCLMTDNGSEFCSKAKDKQQRQQHAFETTLSVFNVKHSRTKPYYPQTNGKIERMNGTVKTEAIRKNTPVTHDEACRILNDYQYEYNYQRLHAGIMYLRPSDIFFGRDKKVLNERKMKIMIARQNRIAKNKALEME